MQQITVNAIDEHHFQVTVFNNTGINKTGINNISTTHQVSIAAEYALKLTAGKITNAQLVKKSFEFLLERESNKSIMRSFNLSDISRYFPEYEEIFTQ